MDFSRWPRTKSILFEKRLKKGQGHALEEVQVHGWTMTESAGGLPLLGSNTNTGSSSKSSSGKDKDNNQNSGNGVQSGAMGQSGGMRRAGSSYSRSCTKCCSDIFSYLLQLRLSPEELDQRYKSREIDKILEKDRRSFRKQVRTVFSQP